MTLDDDAAPEPPPDVLDVLCPYCGAKPGQACDGGDDVPHELRRIELRKKTNREAVVAYLDTERQKYVFGPQADERDRQLGSLNRRLDAAIRATSSAEARMQQAEKRAMIAEQHEALLRRELAEARALLDEAPLEASLPNFVEAASAALAVRSFTVWKHIEGKTGVVLAVHRGALKRDDGEWEDLVEYGEMSSGRKFFRTKRNFLARWRPA